MKSMYEQLPSILPEEILHMWHTLTEEVDRLYDVDRIWNKGFGDWAIEYKYRRGGKTLCTFYAKDGAADLLITLGKAEREKFDAIKDSLSADIKELYENTKTYHDGKWLWIPLESELRSDDIISILKIKRRPNRK